jgi:hypothetical protein
VCNMFIDETKRRIIIQNDTVALTVMPRAMGMLTKCSFNKEFHQSDEQQKRDADDETRDRLTFSHCISEDAHHSAPCKSHMSMIDTETLLLIRSCARIPSVHPLLQIGRFSICFTVPSQNPMNFFYVKIAVSQCPQLLYEITV